MMVTAIILGINFFIEIFVVELFWKVGHKTISALNADILNSIFYSQFFNTGVLILLVNYEIGDRAEDLLTRVIERRVHFDYAPLWYKDISKKIVLTMGIKIVVPIFKCMFKLFKLYIIRWIDTGFTWTPNGRNVNKAYFRSGKTYMGAYKKVHSGD